jgi:translocator assembly and maintenance protein 41
MTESVRHKDTPRADDQEVKYGIIQSSSLIRDLSTWETLYISGRLQKPHLPLLPLSPETSTGLESALANNLKQALSLALILLPGKFTELQLWEKIAGISYAGDPRMSVPGAENPEKVRNIVRGEGALEGFRAMYGSLLEGMVVQGYEWKGDGEGMMTVSTSQACAGKRREVLNHSNRLQQTTWPIYSSPYPPDSFTP